MKNTSVACGWRPGGPSARGCGRRRSRAQEHERAGTRRSSWIQNRNHPCR